jgi:hypothetical protein
MTRISRCSRCLFLLLGIAFSQAGFSQLTFKDYFDEKTPLTWLGVDFTEAKIAGHTDFEVKDLKDRHFTAINELVLNEAKKYDLSKFFHHSDVKTDISTVESHNDKADADKLKSTGGDDENHLSPAAVEKLVKGYNFSGKKGMGAMVVVESMNKTKERGTAYIVFLDLSGGKVLYSEKFNEKGGGFGLRNYWAKLVYNVLDETDGKYKTWKKANGL